MPDVHSRAPIGALLALAFTACALLASGCTKPFPDQSDAKLSVASTQPSGSYQPGDDVAFHVTITNTGKKDVGHVVIQTTLDNDLRQKSLACTGLGASAAVVGPADCTGYIYMLNLAAGASATLDIVATVHSAASATVTNTFQVSALSGPAAVVATSSATVIDARGGTYRAFASTGQAYSLLADFTSASTTLTFAGPGPDVTLPFTTPSNEETYSLSGGAAFRAPHDLLVGTVDLGTGARPFIAARKFVTTIAALDGRTFDTFGLDMPAGASAASRFQTTAFAGSTMQVCADSTPHTLATCPSASLRAYGLSVAEGVFTGVDATTGETLAFQVAQSDSTLVLLRAEATAGGPRFQVGLSANAGIQADQLEGGDSLGRWGTLTLSPPTISEGFPQPDGSIQKFVGGLSAIDGAPAGLAASFIGSSAAPIDVIQDGRLAIVMGQPGSSLDGLLQVFVD